MRNPTVRSITTTPSTARITLTVPARRGVEKRWDSVPARRALIDHIVSDESGDSTRVDVAGISSGDYLVPRIACEIGGKVAAVVDARLVGRPGLASELQTKHRIMVQGPTTLAALLTSLQMGFRTLAIEKRSSEVWQVLGAAKAEFIKYGEVWEKLSRQLDTAKRTVDEAGWRTRAVSKKLRAVEVLDAPEATGLLEFVSADGEEEDAMAAE